jgi:hypothetical protein
MARVHLQPESLSTSAWCLASAVTAAASPGAESAATQRSRQALLFLFVRAASSSPSNS